jgi:hypothetical protein
MAKQDRERLRRKFGATNLKGERLNNLMDEVLSFNSEAVGRRITNINKKTWDKSLRKITPKEKTFILPDVSEVLPKQSVFAIKSAERGKLIRQTLKDSLNKNLRDTLKVFTPKTGEQSFITRRGTTAGKLNPKLIKDFQKTITGTFQNYTKKDPRYGVPSNIRNIAVTEMRSVTNDLNEQYVNTLRQKNADLVFQKGWQQNRTLSKEPRLGHSKVDGKKIGIDDLFRVPLYKKVRGRNILIEMTLMRRPHDQTARAEQVIGCNCELKYTVRRLK